MTQRYVRKVLEKDVETPATKHARARGMRHYKFKSANNRGVPDRIFMGIALNGTRFVFFIEFKRPGKKSADELQDTVIGEMQQAGARIFLTDDIATAKEIIDDFYKMGDTLVSEYAPA
jgi:hypothetical protein